MELLISFFYLIIGFVLLAWGGDTLISGAVKIAHRFHISPLLIGLTIIAFGTSLPEVTVAIVASLSGQTQIAVGNVIGANIANIGFVLGLTACFYPLRIKSGLLKQQFPILVAITILVGLLFMDRNLSRTDGFVLFWTGIVFILVFFQHYRRKRKKEVLKEEYQEEIEIREKTIEGNLFRASLELLAGFVILPVSAKIVINGAVHVATFFAVPSLFIGLTIVALGTTLPELATSIMGARQKQYDIVIGNIIGSNIFNMLVVLAIPAVISPYFIKGSLLIRDFSMMFLMTILLYVFSFINIKRQVNKITRREGFILLSIYFVYIMSLIFVRGILRVV